MSDRQTKQAAIIAEKTKLPYPAAGWLTKLPPPGDRWTWTERRDARRVLLEKVRAQRRLAAARARAARMRTPCPLTEEGD